MDPMQNPEQGHGSQFGSQNDPRERAKEGLENAWKKTQEGIRSMKDQANQGLESVRQRLGDSARSTFIEQKDRSVAGLRRLSLAIHEAAAKLDEEGDHTLAEYTELLSGQVEKAAEYLKHREPGVVLRDFEGFARRQAGLFIGGMFVTGLVVARLIKAAREDRESSATTALAPQDLSPAAPAVPPAPAPAQVQPTIPPSSRFGQGLGPLEP